MSKDIPMISLVRKGTKKYPRYVLMKADTLRNPNYWTGLGWSVSESDALLFDDLNDAAWVYHDLMADTLSDRPCHRFIAPLYIEMYGDRPDLADLRSWLEKAVRVVVDAPRHGSGPQDSVGIMILDTEDTKPV